MKDIILLTAWNDSGAGHLCRYLDGNPRLNVLPFEVLLGSQSTEHISSHNNLVHPWYRWNLFRSHIDHHSCLNFAEPELNMWLSQDKFKVLPEYVQIAKNAISTFHTHYLQFSEDSYVSLTQKYIYMIDSIFYPDSEADILLHVPCASLDSFHPLFTRIFCKVVFVFCNPVMGFLNMSKRNGIDLMRYLHRWYTINSASLDFFKNSNAQSCLVSNTLNASQFVHNARQVHTFLFDEAPSPILCKPTLLAKPLANSFYPFGGLLSLENDNSQSTRFKESFLTLLSADLLMSYLDCSLLYSELQDCAQ